MDGQVLTRGTVDNINPDDIAVIDILEGLLSQAYSDDGTVIQLVRKDPSERKISNPGMLSVQLPGFYTARTFYAPDYTETETTTEGDYRTTLYWDPQVKVGDSAKKLSFFTGDRPGQYRVRAEGLSSDGVPFFTEKVITVR